MLMWSQRKFKPGNYPTASRLMHNIWCPPSVVIFVSHGRRRLVSADGTPRQVHLPGHTAVDGLGGRLHESVIALLPLPSVAATLNLAAAGVSRRFWMLLFFLFRSTPAWTPPRLRLLCTVCSCGGAVCRLTAVAGWQVCDG